MRWSTSQFILVHYTTIQRRFNTSKVHKKFIKVCWSTVQYIWLKYSSLLYKTVQYTTLKESKSNEVQQNTAVYKGASATKEKYSKLK